MSERSMRKLQHRRFSTCQMDEFQVQGHDERAERNEIRAAHESGPAESTTQ